MNMKQKKLRKLWVEALRSGDYRQGDGVLEYRFSDEAISNCCLGVLCHVAKKEGLVDSLKVSPFTGYLVGCSLSENYPDIKEAVGLSLEGEDALINMNDGLEEFMGDAKGFDVIASEIEENDNLFV